MKSKRACTSCGTTRSLDSFNFRCKADNIRHCICKFCVKKNRVKYKDYTPPKGSVETAVKQYREKHKEKLYGGQLISTVNTPIGWAKWKVNTLKAGAKRRNIDFDITYEDILPLMVDKCPVLGVPLYYDRLSHTTKYNINSPSVDRIHNHIGYIPENITIVSTLVNRYKSDLSIKDLIEISNNIQKFYGAYL